ncbi:MAG: hypothetical protein WCK17_14880, partial [Verrucomicrobiota bacterium]
VLNRAVAHAAGIAKARDEVTNILKRKTDRLDAAKEQFTGKEIVEIYHDESGTVTDRRFVVAHLVVGFESEPSASCANDAAKEEVFYIDQPTGYAAYTFQTPALEQWTNQLGDAFNRIVTKAKAALAPFVVAADEPLQAQGGDRFGLIDPEGLDNINNDLLRLLAEVILFDSLPWILSVSAKLHYRAATRMRNVSMLNGETQWDLDKKLKDKWGNYSPLSNPSANEYSWQSLSVGNIAPMLADVIGGRGESEKRGFVERAIETAFGQTMSKGQLPKLLDFKYLHYFADRIATLTQYHDVTKLVSLAQLGACVALASSVTGFTGVRSRLLGLLNAHRCLDVDDKGGALFLATSGILAADLVSDVLLHRLQAKLPFLNGREYMNFVRYKEELPQYLKQNTLGAPQRLSIKQTAASPQASGGSSRQYARGQAQMQGAARPKLKTVRRMHPDTVCIKGLPPAVDEGALVAELANLGLEGEVMSIKRNSTSALVLIKVGEERLNQLLADQQSHFTLFSTRCQVTQAFEMVRED